ncbi:hypothetical protein [Streptomyces sp. UNOC14_S4]|uniref:hypothetical protein n=1 Tax=Streptomyces sp. UNOC14_S4 TaxID=2872340 RepID=UPI001E562AB1|nr:hypothetical protein [Streptomyces sp. UNOC14_S4]MCC3771515.1 hypothetical protein [Streptomyces sp. UNOC14_S4]
MALPEQLKPGDVVLTRGTEAISRAICLMDGSEVSHAALAVDGDTLAEAVGEGLRTIPYARALEGHDLLVGRSLAAPADMAPVLDVARRYLSGKISYAHQQVVLLAVLCVTRRVPLPLGGRRLVRTVLDQAAAAVNALAECGRQPMICSEFVYRCYHEARPSAPYALRVDDGSDADGQSTLLGWAQAHPALSHLPLPGKAPALLDPAALEAVLAPLVSAYASATGKLDSLPFGKHVPAPAGLTDPGDEEMLASMTAFGAALHRADSPDDEPVTPEQALEKIRAKAAEPNFVTPGDLLHSASLVERLRTPDSKKPASPLAGLLRGR